MSCPVASSWLHHWPVFRRILRLTRLSNVKLTSMKWIRPCRRKRTFCPYNVEYTNWAYLLREWRSRSSVLLYKDTSEVGNNSLHVAASSLMRAPIIPPWHCELASPRIFWCGGWEILSLTSQNLPRLWILPARISYKQRLSCYIIDKWLYYVDCLDTSFLFAPSREWR